MEEKSVLDGLTPEDLEHWRKAGKIAAQALEYGGGLIKKGASLLEVSDMIEKKIIDLGGQIAFPAQISCDNIAAHYCADPDDKTIFENQVACLDVGVHVSGAIGDNALTVDLSGKWSELVKASREALNNAIKIVQIGTSLGEIGKTIQETISSYGFSPVKNLSGHGLDYYDIHTKPTIPNFDTGDKTELKKGMIIAIEPFATNGAGMIYEKERANIFMLTNPKPVRSPFAREILKFVAENYKTLPFTTRWLSRKFGLGKTNFALRELLKNDIIKQFPPLPEKNKGIVSQAEHTLLIEDKVEILTKNTTFK
ncbi:type II methionyl aminopeptidase [Candidatus Woesearchaeota archaeon]|nr:type II methionyl aminopeptidase [Candidatus Woesearchaeota archaeon]